MWLNEHEEKIIGQFADFLNANKDGQMKIKTIDGSVFIVKYVTSYESDNGLDVFEDGYEEMWEYSLSITQIIDDPTNMYLVGDILDINYHCVPLSYSRV